MLRSTEDTTMTTDEQHLAPSLILEFVTGIRVVRPHELRHFRSCGQCLKQWCEIKRRADLLLPSALSYRIKGAHPMGHRGEINPRFGVYKSLCCGVKVPIPSDAP